MSRKLARFAPVDEEQHATLMDELSPLLMALVLSWVAKRVLSSDAIMVFAERAKWLAEQLVSEWDKSALQTITQSLRDAMIADVSAEKWLTTSWPRIENAYGYSSKKMELAVETAALRGTAAGQYAYDFSPRRVLAGPYWVYMTMGDDRVRPTHAELEGRIFSKTDAFAHRYLPPWEWGCRCSHRSLSQADVDAMGARVDTGTAIPFMTIAGGKKIGLPGPVFNRDRVEELVPDAFTKSLQLNR